MQATVKPDFDELAPPDDVYGLTRRAAVASAPFTQVLTTTDSVLSQKGGIENLKIYRELLRDDQVASTWGQRRLGLTSCETVVEPGGDDALSKAAAEELQAQIEAMAWDDITDKALYSAFYGWGVSEIMWRPDGNRVAFDRIVVRDRARFRFDIKGSLYLWQDGAYRLMPERKFWVMRNGGDNHDEPYGVGIANALYWPVFFKRNDIKFWLIFLEKFGMPTAQAKIPAGQMSDPVLVNQAKAVLKNIATDAGVVVPDSVVIELIEASRSGTADYSGMLEAMNGAISKIVVGQTMTTDNGSSLSQAQVHERVAQAIKEADSDLLCGSFNLGPVKWWTEWNFPGAKPPRVYRHTAPPEDMAKRAERDTKIVGLGYEPTEDYIKETYGEGWVKKAPEPIMGLLGKPNDRAEPPANFAEGEAVALAAMRAARRLDQSSIFNAAQMFADQYQTVTGERVRQLLQAAEFSEDSETFKRKLDEILAEKPPEGAQRTLSRSMYFANLFGALRGQRGG
jgi:phage gp29-like protein